VRIKFDNTVLLILLIFFFLICLSFKTVFALSIDAISSDVLLITYILSQEPYKIPQPLLLAIYEQESSGGKNLGVNMGSREENIKRCTAMCNPSSDFCLRTYSDEYTNTINVPVISIVVVVRKQEAINRVANKSNLTSVIIKIVVGGKLGVLISKIF